MSRPESPKPPLAPKPRTTSPLTPLTAPKFPLAPRPDGLHSPTSVSRGPKPPLAPKPRLASPGEWRASWHVVNSLSKCSNGTLPCGGHELWEGRTPDLSPHSPVPGDTKVEEVDRAGAAQAPDTLGEDDDQAPPAEDMAAEEDLSPEGEEDDGQAPPAEDMAAEEDLSPEGEEDDGQAPPAEDMAAEKHLSPEGEEDDGQAPPAEDMAAEKHLSPEGEEDDGQAPPAEDMAAEEDLSPEGEEDDGQAPPAEDMAAEKHLSPEGEEDDGQAPPAEDMAAEKHLSPEGEEDDGQAPPAEDTAAEEHLSPEGEEDDGQAPPAEDMVAGENSSPGGVDDDLVSPAEDTAAEKDSAWDTREDSDGQGPPAEDTPTGEDIAPDPKEEGSVLRSDQEEKPADSHTVGSLDDRGTAVDSHLTSTSGLPEMAREEDSDGGPSSGAPQADSTAEASGKVGPEDSVAVIDSASPQGQDGALDPMDGAATEALEEGEHPESGEHPAGEEHHAEEGEHPEEEGEHPTEQEGEPPKEEEGEHLEEEEGEYFMKEEGEHPEEEGREHTEEDSCHIVPFESGSLEDLVGSLPGAPYRLFATESTSFCGQGCTGEDPVVPAEDPNHTLANPYDLGGDPGDEGPPPEGKAPRARAHSGKLAGGVPETVLEEPVGAPACCPHPHPNLHPHPRSFSVEARDPGASSLSLPCSLGSSGSFSRCPVPAGGSASPCSLLDIPPPFELACFTRWPVTKSSPSLLAAVDTPERPAKKKKSSFKRFLALTFGRRADTRAPDASPGPLRSPGDRLLELDRCSPGGSPRSRVLAAHPRAGLLFPRGDRRRAAPGRPVSRVESFEDRARPPLLPLPITKPRSVSFPSAHASEYENVPAASDYENVQLPPARPPATLAKLFEDQSRALGSASENDGYVDMSSFSTFDSRPPGAQQDAESAYTEPYKVCPVSAAPKEDLTSEEDQGSSEEEDGVSRDPSLAHKVDGQSRAHAIAQDLLTSEKAYVELLQHLHLDFHGAMSRALGELASEDREELLRGLGELPALHALHRGLLAALTNRLLNWEGEQQVADMFLAREAAFEHHKELLRHLDSGLSLLAGRCLLSPRLAAAVRGFESLQGGGQSVKHWLLKVAQRPFQYQVLLTDYLNNLCPDSPEYDSTQGALNLISKITDQANESLEQGENLQKLVHVEYRVQGASSLLQPGREFLKEGTLMKVTGRSRRPRHLFLMSDVLLYTYPQKDGKYRLKSTLGVAAMKVSRPMLDKVPYALRIEAPECCLTLSASSCVERDEWLSFLSRARPEDSRAPGTFQLGVEVRERLGGSLGERPPTLVPVTHVVMCMNCGCDFSLTLRRHHCHACGKIVCRNCSRNKYPLKYLKDRLAKVCDGCYGELRRRGGDGPGLSRARPVSMSFPLPSARFSSGTFSSVLQSFNSSPFRKQRKVPSALSEVSASGEGSAISGYLSRCKKARRPWKRLWFVIKGKVLFTYTASEDAVAMESLPLLGFTIAPEKEQGGSEVGPVFHLFHKKTLFYSFRAEDGGSAQRWIQAMEDASVL
ncbi:FYVE, RhoGEF and PH domain-containing protein 5 isoform X2 [Erinaceus europaeus]|uniref:FYVE, RhoGEF and PH domain-containing protein 5 isoform X2 n=1 Tax=Erinaceus europaeus TaxID=9365 RepID=A0ABM3WJ80_ERIEU|nr:FYVE, RhoGEF and PH domain-containing protein 5 isoform X2 [Erinaceus europaeus]